MIALVAATVWWLALSYDPTAERHQRSGEVTLEIAPPAPPAHAPEAVAAPPAAEPSPEAVPSPPQTAAKPAAEAAKRPQAKIVPRPQAPEAPKAAPPQEKAAPPEEEAAPPEERSAPTSPPSSEPPPLPPEARTPGGPPSAPPPADDSAAVAPPPDRLASPKPSPSPPPAPLPHAPVAAPRPPLPPATSSEPAAPRASRPAVGEQQVALAPVPDPDLIERAPSGPLPVIAPDGRRAWQVYGRPFDEADKRPRIAIVIAGMGQSRSADDAAIQGLPGAVTLAFTPYAHDLEAWIQEARAAGHEVMLLLPMEPDDFPRSDPGPRALLTSLSPAENFDRLEWLLSRVTGYVGVANYLGSRFTTSPEHLRPVLHILRQRGLLFLDSRASPDSQGGRIAREIALPHALNNRFIDAEASRPAIDRRLAELEGIARETGTAVGMGVPYPVTIERVARWANKLAERGFALAPVSATVNRQEVE